MDLNLCRRSQALTHLGASVTSILHFVIRSKVTFKLRRMKSHFLCCIALLSTISSRLQDDLHHCKSGGDNVRLRCPPVHGHSNFCHGHKSGMTWTLDYLATWQNTAILQSHKPKTRWKIKLFSIFIRRHITSPNDFKINIQGFLQRSQVQEYLVTKVSGN